MPAPCPVRSRSPEQVFPQPETGQLFACLRRRPRTNTEANNQTAPAIPPPATFAPAWQAHPPGVALASPFPPEPPAACMPPVLPPVFGNTAPRLISAPGNTAPRLISAP